MKYSLCTSRKIKLDFEKLHKHAKYERLKFLFKRRGRGRLVASLPDIAKEKQKRDGQQSLKVYHFLLNELYCEFTNGLSVSQQSKSFIVLESEIPKSQTTVTFFSSSVGNIDLSYWNFLFIIIITNKYVFKA